MSQSLNKPHMIKLRKITKYSKTAYYQGYIEGINKIRSHYEWSKQQFTSNNIDDVWLICLAKNVVGFLQADYDHLDLSSRKKVCLKINGLHIAPSKQQSGIGTFIIQFLLKKGLDLEFVIAKDNKKVQGLINKFNYKTKYETENTLTIYIESRLN